MKEISPATRPGKAPIGVVIAIIILAALGGIAFQHSRSVHAQKAAAAEAVTLLPSTEAVLNGLKSPLEIRFYSPADQPDVPARVGAFAKRLDELLSAYERASAGHIKIVRCNPQLDSGVKAKAEADGIKPVPYGEGDGLYYLGLAVQEGNQKGAVAELSPDWEQAAESDLSRAIRQVSAAQDAAATVANSSKYATAADEAVRANSSLSGVSADEGARILRDAALAEFKAAATEMQTQIAEAEQRIVQAQNNNSSADEQAAKKQLQEIQSEQSSKLKDIAARLDGQIAALQRWKTTGQQPMAAR